MLWKRIAAAVTGLALLGAAYGAGRYLPVPRAAPAPLLPPRGAAVDLAERLRGVDFAGAVAAIQAASHADASALPETAPARAAHLQAVVDTLHSIVLDYIADRHGLSPEQRGVLQHEFLTEHSDLAVTYRQMLGRAADTLAARPEMVSYQAYSSVNAFVHLFSGEVCDMLPFPGRFLLRNLGEAAAQLDVASTLQSRLSCRQVLAEAVTPIATHLREQAVIQDLNTSKLAIDAQVRRAIAELATAEEHVTADFEDAYTARFLLLRQTATIRAHAQATVKVGFDLNSRFGTEIDHARRVFIIRLPAPRVLSSDVTVQFTDIDNSMLVSIDREKYNAALVKAREMVLGAVSERGIYTEAQRNAERVLLALFQPVLSLPQFGYAVYVRFPNSPPDLPLQAAAG